MSFEMEATQLKLENRALKTQLDELRAALQELGEENQGLQMEVAKQQGRCVWGVVGENRLTPSLPQRVDGR